MHKKILFTVVEFIYQENDAAALLPVASLWELVLVLLFAV